MSLGTRRATSHPDTTADGSRPPTCSATGTSCRQHRMGALHQNWSTRRAHSRHGRALQDRNLRFSVAVARTRGPWAVRCLKVLLSYSSPRFHTASLLVQNLELRAAPKKAVRRPSLTGPMAVAALKRLAVPAGGTPPVRDKYCRACFNRTDETAYHHSPPRHLEELTSTAQSDG